MPLTREQFNKARASGFSTEQIIGFEKKRETAQPVAQPKPDMVQEIGGGFARGLSGGFRPLMTIGGAALVSPAGPFGAVTGHIPQMLGTTPLEIGRKIASLPERVAPIPQPTTIPGKVAEAAGGLAPLLIGAAPFQAGAAKILPKVTGFLPGVARSAIAGAGYGGTTAVLEGQPVLPSALETAKQFGAFHALGGLGAGLTPKMPRLGSALGAAGAGALLAPEGEKEAAAITGLGMGAAFPSAPLTVNASKFAGRINNSLIKPSAKEFLYGKNPGEGIAREGIWAKDLNSLGAKTEARTKELTKQLDAITEAPQNAVKKLDAYNALKPLFDLEVELKSKPASNATYIQRVSDIFTDLGNRQLDNLTPKQAIELKRFISDFQDWGKIGGKDRDINIAIRKVYHNIDNLVDTAIPETKQLNSRIANLISASQAIRHRSGIEQRSNLLGLSPRLTGLAGGAMVGNLPGGVAGYLGGMALEKAISSPLVKTGAASLMSKKYPGVQKPMGQGGFARVGSSKKTIPSVSNKTIPTAKGVSAEEWVAKKFAEKPSYGMSHRPTYEGMPPSHNLLEGGVIPKDVYEHPEFSIASGRNINTDKAAQQSWKVLQKIRNNPEAEVTVYRAGRENKLNNGDWITFSREYANQSLEAPEKVYSFKIKAKDAIFAGDDINEFGYYPKSKLLSEYEKNK